MTASARIVQFRDFWDVPRIFVVTCHDKVFLFDCPFDEEVEDFPEFYRVYMMPPLSELDLSGSWYGLEEQARVFLGEVPIAQIQFDDSRHKEIDATVLQELSMQVRK